MTIDSNASADGPAATPTERFRRQHAELAAMAGEIQALLRRETVSAHAADVRKRVARFAGKLQMHAVMEGQALYPRLLASEDLAVRALAERFVDELGHIYEDFFAFIRNWPDAASIEADPLGFIRATQAVFRVLERRMVRENDELYPLADRDA